MEKKVIPIPYQIILKKFCDAAYENVLETSKARHILGWGMRMNKRRATLLLLEMKNCGWIEFQNHMSILMKVNGKDLV